MRKQAFRNKMLLVVLGLIAFSQIAQEGFAQSVFKTKKLKNGLEIVVVENHLTPIATVVYVAKNGSYTESQEFAGLSHLYEHMFFKKNRVMPNEEAFNEKNRELGMSNNASTAEEVVEYHFTMPSKNLQEGIEFMSNAIEAPAFDPADVEREREVVLGEFDRNEASPFFPISRAMDSALWGENVVRKQPLGQRPVIKAATQQKMFEIMRKFYIPNNSAILVSGDVKADEVFKYVEQYLGDWQPGPAPFPKYYPPTFAPVQTQLIVRDAPGVPTVSTTITWYGPSVGKETKDTYAADLWSTILNSPTSRLYKNLVDAGLALGVNVSYYTQQNVGPITISIDATPEKSKEALKALWNEISHWSDNDYVSEQEIKNAKERIAIQRLYEQENPVNFIQGVAFSWAVTGLNYYNDYVNNMQKVTHNDLKNYVTKYITNKPHVMGITADKQILQEEKFTAEEVLR